MNAIMSILVITVALGGVDADHRLNEPANGLLTNAGMGPFQASPGHQEKVHDRYLPTPAQPEVLPERASLAQGSFVSVQVNVDAFGNNIFGDAANEPSIAVDPNDPNRIAIGWRQFDSIESDFRQAGVAYSQDGGDTWTFPGVLQPGQFRSDPVLDSDADGNFYYYSLSTLASAEFFKSTDGGVHWTGPVPGRGGDKAWIAVDRTAGVGRGNIYASWNIQFSCCNGDFTRSTDGGKFFMDPVQLPLSPRWGTISVGPDGEVYESGIGATVVKSTNAQDPGATPFFSGTFVDLGGTTVFAQGPNPGGLLGQVWIATDHSDGPSRGNVYLLASVRPLLPNALDVMFARSADGGQTWSSPVRVNDDPTDNGAWQWFGTMSVAPNGRIDAFWNDTRNTAIDNLSQLYYAYSTDTGLTWSENVAVSPVFDSHVGWPQQAKLGDYYHSVSDAAGVNLAYAATFNGEQDVYFLRVHHTIGDSDADSDGDTDLIDYAAFQDCVTGDHTSPDYVPPSQACEVFDFDLDDDIDLLDHGVFGVRFTGDCGVTIVSSPDDVTTCLGGGAFFEVDAAGNDLVYQWRRDGDDIPGASEPVLVIDPVTLQSEAAYVAVVQSGCAETQSNPASLELLPRPAFTTHPENADACLGGSVQFVVEAVGEEPITYQWRKGGQSIPGATAPTLLIDPVTVDDEGSYRCLVTDGCKQFTTSNAGNLTLVDILIEVQPVDADLCVGDTLFIFVVATPPASYQWFKDGELMDGANFAFLAISSAGVENSGAYHVEISNVCGSVASDAAVVSVTCGGACPACQSER